MIVSVYVSNKNVHLPDFRTIKMEHNQIIFFSQHRRERDKLVVNGNLTFSVWLLLLLLRLIFFLIPSSSSLSSVLLLCFVRRWSDYDDYCKLQLYIFLAYILAHMCLPYESMGLSIGKKEKRHFCQSCGYCDRFLLPFLLPVSCFFSLFFLLHSFCAKKKIFIFKSSL